MASEDKTQKAFVKKSKPGIFNKELLFIQKPFGVRTKQLWEGGLPCA
jgi:hypothetical protein